MGDGGVRLIVVEAGETGAEELGEELVAGHGGGAAATALAAVDLDEGVADGRQQGKGDSELLKLGGVPPVFEGVEVALGCSGAGSSTAPRHCRSPFCVCLSTDGAQQAAPLRLGGGKGEPCPYVSMVECAAGRC